MPALSHGLSTSKTYKAWSDIKQRCYNKKSVLYKWYGEKGITMCDRWLESFKNFLNDMGEAPKNCVISRFKDKGNYEPNNCEWKLKNLNSSEVTTGERNPKAKLTTEQILCIRSLAIGAHKSYTGAAVAKDLNTTRQTINNILSYRTWTHI
jgi:hypothetical protein